MRVVGAWAFLTTGVVLLVMALVAIPVVTTRAIEAARAVAGSAGCVIW